MTAPTTTDAGSRPDPTAVSASRLLTDALIEQEYPRLRQIARRFMRAQRPDHTLQPTALVHEAFLRLASARSPGWATRAELLAVAATTMRRVLVDLARRRGAAKRAGGRRVTLVDGCAIEPAGPIDLLALDEALTRLGGEEARVARVVELRFFGGLECEEVAEALGVSVPTVKRDWRFARAWLARELRDERETRA